MANIVLVARSSSIILVPFYRADDFETDDPVICWHKLAHFSGKILEYSKQAVFDQFWGQICLPKFPKFC